MSTLTSLDYLKELSDNNSEFMMEMIETFLSQTPRMLELLEKHYQQNEFSLLQKLAHKMKPTLPMMGISGFENDFKSIENIGINESRDDAKFSFHYKRIQETLEKVYPELEISLKNLKTGGV
ncbi:MAG: Hpt domain-containing protein [Cytophagales bacterium]